MRFRENPLAILSPGQGVQRAGMGEALYGRSDEARRVFYEASLATGVDVAEVCFGSQTDRLEETLVAQPAIAAVTISEFAYLKSLGLRFDAGMGHSMGEVPLLAMAGSLAVGDTFKLLQARAEATSRASNKYPGIMAAVSGLTLEQIGSRASHLFEKGRLAIANINGTMQQVFSGDHEPIDELERMINHMRLTERLRVRFTRLSTGGAFHSRHHMQEAVGEFLEAAQSVVFTSPEFEIMLNNAKYLDEIGSENLPQYLSHQLISQVDFVNGPQQLINDGVRNFMEVGPDRGSGKLKTLSGLLKREFGQQVSIIEVDEISNGSKTNDKSSQ